MYAATDDGVLLRHADDAFVLAGSAAYSLVSAVIPRLDGRHTVAELTAGLPPEKVDLVFRLVTALRDRSFIRNTVTSSVTLPPAVAGQFASQLGHLEEYSDDAAGKFRAFRECRVLVLGSGAVTDAAAKGLLRNGARTVDVSRHHIGDDAWWELAAEARQLRDVGCPARVRDVGQLNRAESEPYDVVLAPLPAADIRALLERKPGTPTWSALIPLMVIGRRAVVGPLSRAGSRACWSCAVPRLAANLDPGSAAALWRAMTSSSWDRGPATVPGPVGRMLGNLLAYEAFRLSTGAPAPETDRAVIVQELDTLDVERDDVLPHPLCTSHGRLPRGSQPEVRETHGLLGRYGGVLSHYSDSGLRQLPVKVGRVRLNPAVHYERGPRDIVAFGLDSTAEARRRAVETAALRYVAELNERPMDGHDGDTGEYVDPDRLVVASGIERSSGPEPLSSTVDATSLVSGRTYRLPAAAVFPESPLNSGGRFERTSAGSGCGGGRTDALRAGLLSALAYDGVLGAVTGTHPAVALGTAPHRPLVPADTSAVADTADWDFLCSVAHDVATVVDVWRLPGAAPARAVLAVIDRPEWNAPVHAVRAELDLHDAAVAALRDAIGMAAVSSDLGNGAGVDAGAELLPGFDPRALNTTVEVQPSDGARQAGGVAGLVDDLARCGRDALLVDTTPVDLRVAGLVTVRVLLTD